MEADTCSAPLINHLRRRALPRRGGTARCPLEPHRGQTPAATWAAPPARLNALGLGLLQGRGWASFLLNPHTATAALKIAGVIPWHQRGLGTLGTPRGQGHSVCACRKGQFPPPWKDLHLLNHAGRRALFSFGAVVLFALAQPCAAAPIQLPNQNLKHPPRLLFPDFPASQVKKIPSGECHNSAET